MNRLGRAMPIVVGLIILCATVLAALGVLDGARAGELFLVTLAYVFGVATPTALDVRNDVARARGGATGLRELREMADVTTGKAIRHDTVDGVHDPAKCRRCQLDQAAGAP